jgi:hypothetical protein
MAALAALEAMCSPPSCPTLADFVAVARRASQPRNSGRGGWGSASPACRSTPSRRLEPMVANALVGKEGSFLGRLSEVGRHAVGVGVAMAGGPSAVASPAPVGVARPPSPPWGSLPSLPSSRCPDGPSRMGPAQDGPRPTVPVGLVLPWWSQDDRARSGPAASAWLWLQRGSTSLALGFPAPSSQVRRHARDAKRVVRHPPPPPLSRSFHDALMKRFRSSSPSASPPHHRRVRASSPTPKLYRPPARRSPVRRSPGWHSPGRRSPTRRSPPNRRSPSRAPRDVAGRVGSSASCQDLQGRGSPRSPHGRSPGHRGHSPEPRGPSPAGRRMEQVLRASLEQRPRPDVGRGSSSSVHQGSWRHDREVPRPLAGAQKSQSAAVGEPVKRKKKNKKKKTEGSSTGGVQGGIPTVPVSSARPLDGHGRSQAKMPVPQVQVVPREKSPTSNICFNCGVVGHFCSECTAPEQCLLCGDESHLAAACTARYRRKARETLEFLGHGIDGGFYYMDMGDAEISVPRHLAVITVLPSQDPPLSIEVTADTIHSELSQLESACVWTVREVAPSDVCLRFLLLVV